MADDPSKNLSNIDTNPRPQPAAPSAPNQTDATTRAVPGTQMGRYRAVPPVQVAPAPVQAAPGTQMGRYRATLPTSVADAGARLNQVLTGGAPEQIPPVSQMQAQGPQTPAQAQALQAYFASPEAEAARMRLNAQQPGTAEHAVANPHVYTRDEFVNALRGQRLGNVLAIMQALKPPTMQEQAMSRALEGAAGSGQQGATQQELNMIAFGGNPALMYDPELLNIGVRQPGRGAVDPNAWQ